MTNGELIDLLQRFPREWPVRIALQAGGDIAVEHRERLDERFVAIFGSNGGRFGEDPLTEDVYQKRKKEFLEKYHNKQCKYTSAYGEHMIYLETGSPIAPCYGQSFDVRVVERMISEGVLTLSKEDIERVRYLTGYKANK